MSRYVQPFIQELVRSMASAGWPGWGGGCRCRRSGRRQRWVSDGWFVIPA